jgi:SurA N-terminal domain
MLEQMRKQGASIFVYLIFCLLIAIFVINFRPGQSRNDDNGCSGTSNVVLSVDGTEATQTAFKMAYSSPYNWGTSKSKVHIALETLIRRELLANEGEKRGLLVDEDLVNEEIKKGRFFSATPPPPGQSEDVEAIYRPIRKAIQGVFDENGLWNIKAYKNWVGSLNISQNAYIEEQKRSLLA